jgi:hypothetical protein
MENPTFIACLYAYDECKDARSVVLANWRCIPAQLINPEETTKFQDLPSREPSAQPEDNNNKNNEPDPPGYLFEPGLLLTIQHGPKGGDGFVFGFDENKCDIVLPRKYKQIGPNLRDRKRLIADRHGCLTFDDQKRLILRDFSYGTRVIYSGVGKGEKRSNFKWILGPGVPEKLNETIVIEFHKDLKFQIIVFRHEIYWGPYVDNVNQFLAEVAANSDLPFGELGVQSVGSTTGPSVSHTPGGNALLLKVGPPLGCGRYGIVYRVCNASTGHEYALKEPLHPREIDWKRWILEFEFMKQISHVSKQKQS